MSIKSSLQCSIAGAVLAFASMGLYAESAPISGIQLDSVQHTTAVRYSDLNLNSPSDVAELYHRISNAAEEVCGPRPEPVAQSAATSYARCVNHAVAHAVARIARPALTAFYQQQQRTGPRALEVATQQ